MPRGEETGQTRQTNRDQYKQLLRDLENIITLIEPKDVRPTEAHKYKLIDIINLNNYKNNYREIVFDIARDGNKLLITIKLNVEECPITEKKISIERINNDELNNDELRDMFVKLIKQLKEKKEELDNEIKNCRNKRAKNEARNKAYVLDTCYTESKAGALATALSIIKRELGEKFTKFLELLIPVYAYSDLASTEIYEKIEWFISLVRAAAKMKNDEAYLPLCPTMGDAIAITYYYIIHECFKEGGTCRNSILGNDISISKNEVCNILSELLKCTNCTRGEDTGEG